MRASVGAVVIAVALLGCVVPTAPPLATPAPDTAAALWVQRLPGQQLSGEPFISRSGATIAVAPGYPDQTDLDLNAPYMWVSHDGGETYRKVVIPSQNRAGTLGPVYDIDVLVQDGWMFVAVMWASVIEISSSTDGGASWRSLGLSPPEVDRPWLVAGPGRAEISLVYFQRSTGAWLWTLQEDGTSRHAPIYTHADTRCICAAGKPAVDPATGALAMPMTSLEGELLLARSVDDTWAAFEISATGLPPTTSVGGIYSLAYTDAGLLLAWPAVDEERHAMYAALSPDFGATWGDAWVATPPNETGAYGLALSLDGTPAVAEYAVEGTFKSYARARGEWRAAVEIFGEIPRRLLVTDPPAHIDGFTSTELRDFLSAAAGPEVIDLAFASDADGPPKSHVARFAR